MYTEALKHATIARTAVLKQPELWVVGSVLVRTTAEHYSNVREYTHRYRSVFVDCALRR